MKQAEEDLELDLDDGAGLDNDSELDMDLDGDVDESDPKRGGILQSTSKRVRMIFSPHLPHVISTDMN